MSQFLQPQVVHFHSRDAIWQIFLSILSQQVIPCGTMRKWQQKQRSKISMKSIRIHWTEALAAMKTISRDCHHTLLKGHRKILTGANSTRMDRYVVCITLHVTVHAAFVRHGLLKQFLSTPTIQKSKRGSFNTGSTVAHLAAQTGDMNALKQAVEKKKDSVNATDRNGWTVS